MITAKSKLSIYFAVLITLFSSAGFSQSGEASSTFSVVGWTGGSLTPLPVDNTSSLNTNITFTGAPDNPGDGGVSVDMTISYTYSVYLRNGSTSYLIGTHKIMATNDYPAGGHATADWYDVLYDGSNVNVTPTGTAFTYNIATTDPIGSCVPAGTYMVDIVINQDYFLLDENSLIMDFDWYAYANNSGSLSNKNDGNSGSVSGLYDYLGGSTNYTFPNVAQVAVTLVPGFTPYSLPSVGISTLPTSGTICDGSSITLTASGASTYQWYTSTISGGTLTPDTTTSAITVSPTSTTIFTVVGTSSSTGCSASATSTVTVNALPTVSITPASSLICEGSSTSLMASGTPSTYLWSNGSPNASSGTLTPISTTTYIVTSTSTSDGCTASASSTVTVDAMAASISPSSIFGCLTEPVTRGGCAITSPTLTASESGGLGTIHYTWNHGSTTNTCITTTCWDITATYTVTVTDAHCSATASVCTLGTTARELIESEDSSISFSIYPNPTSNNIILDLSNVENSTYSVRIFDLLGNEVTKTISVVKNAGERKLDINVNDLAPSVYICELKGDKTYRKQFVKQ